MPGMTDPTPARSQRIVDRLREMTAELSGYALDDVAAASTFLELGFDSLFLTQLAQAFEQAFDVKVTFRQLFDETPTLQALADAIDRALPAGSLGAAAAPAAAERPPVGSMPPVMTEAGTDPTVLTAVDEALFMAPDAVTRIVRASRETVMVSAETPLALLRRSAFASSLPRRLSSPSVAFGASLARASAVASTAF